MRRLIDFICDGTALAGSIDEAPATTGLLIVSGGNEIRIGANRGMALLARDISASGHPVCRFDRRGIGDSEGSNGGYASSGPDIAAATAAFRDHCPSLNRIVAFGNCDAATALVLHASGFDALLLANPWVIEPTDDLPPPAAIRDRYARRLRDPAAWAALLSGKIDLRALGRGLGRIAAKPPVQLLVERFAQALASSPMPITILLADGDNTAIAFREAWQGAAFDTARNRGTVRLVAIASTSHSFSTDADYAALKSALLEALAA